MYEDNLKGNLAKELSLIDVNIELCTGIQDKI